MQPVITFALAKGRLAEQAFELLEQLGIDREEISVEVVEMPVRKLFRSTPAKIRVTLLAEEEENARKAEAEAAAKAELGAEYKVPHYDLSDGTVKVPAAWMIEQCGWKGRRSGGAAVWEKQPLVIVNYTGEAFPEEIIGLERRIVASVKAKFDIELHPEVEHI